MYQSTYKLDELSFPNTRLSEQGRSILSHSEQNPSFFFESKKINNLFRTSLVFDL